MKKSGPPIPPATIAIRHVRRYRRRDGAKRTPPLDGEKVVIQLAEQQREADARQAEIDRAEREKKHAYEKSLIENDRARRVGRKLKA